ncbi:MAG: hypothetical protein WKF50_08715 [Nocardioides sp.]
MGDVLLELGVLDVGAALPAAPEARAALAQEVIGAVDRMRPAELGRLAPLVSRAAEAGDQVAIRLAEAAVTGLVQTLAAVQESTTSTGPDVVLAGSVLLSPGPVRSGVRRAVLQRWGLAARDAGDGAGGAAVLALRRSGRQVTLEVHARLTGP